MKRKYTMMILDDVIEKTWRIDAFPQRVDPIPDNSDPMELLLAWAKSPENTAKSKPHLLSGAN
jgi:hypothetical protein